MAELSDILNETIRAEIEDFLDDPDEINTAIELFSNSSEKMQLIAEAVIMGEDDEVDRITQESLEEGIEALEVMDDGLIAGMSIVGIKFRENFIFVPEVLVCARAMKAGMAHIEPILSSSGLMNKGTVVMGTVKGDLHDIGKNLCIMMLRGAGYTVVDCGVDTAPEEFIQAVRDNDARVMGMSALLTTTMPNMGKTIEAFVDEGIRTEVGIMVGGAPVTEDFAESIGADAYGKDAMACVEAANSLSGLALVKDRA